MKESLITFETAKLAKEKGFNEKTNFAFYYDGTQTWNDPGYDILIARPTQSLLQKWLREVHKIDISINLQTGIISKKYYWYFISKDDKEINDCQDKFEDILEKSSQDIKGNYVNNELLEKYLFEDMFAFETYEEALQQALFQALILIK